MHIIHSKIIVSKVIFIVFRILTFSNNENLYLYQILLTPQQYLHNNHVTFVFYLYY